MKIQKEKQDRILLCKEGVSPSFFDCKSNSQKNKKIRNKNINYS